MTRSALDIINKRALPGLLIFDREYRLLYFNQEALEILSGRTLELEGYHLPQIPEEVIQLCDRLKSGSTAPYPKGEGSEMVDAVSGKKLSLRASFIGSVEGRQGMHIMVLIERIMERREIDLELAQREFHFSRKEMEVLQCICVGLPNRKIAESMFISEYTVKNHIKNIMRRMRVRSRNEILAALL